MPYMIVLCMVIVALLCVLGVARAQDATERNVPTPVTRRSVRSLSRDQLQEKLRALDSRAAPEPKMGAMCYDMAAPPERADYVCPRCGEKTLYARNDAAFVAWELDACRREFEILRKESDLALALDESSYCAHCSPSARLHRLALVVTYADGSSHTNAPVSCEDLRILRGFMKGRRDYETFNDGTRPLKEVMLRLRELLDVAPDQAPKTK